MKKSDEYYLERGLQLSIEAMEAGDTPFAALLVSKEGEIIMEQRNEVLRLHDRTAHAEAALASRASRKYEQDYLWDCTLYTTVEPCPMCTCAIYWANIGNIVYGMSESQLLEITGDNPINPTVSMKAKEVLKTGQKDIKLRGPIKKMEEKIAEVHKKYW